MMLKPYTGQTGVKGCSKCREYTELARMYTGQGKADVTVHLNDGRTRHIHGVSYRDVL